MKMKLKLIIAEISVIPSHSQYTHFDHYCSKGILTVVFRGQIQLQGKQDHPSSAAEAPHLEFNRCKPVASGVDLMYREPVVYTFSRLHLTCIKVKCNGCQSV